MRLKEVALLLEAFLTGDPDAEVTRCASMENAGPGSVVFAEDAKFAQKAVAAFPTAVIVSPNIRLEGMNTLEVERPAAAFAKLMDLLHPVKQFPAEVHPSAIIHPWATIGEGCHIAHGVGIGPRAALGNKVVLHAGVSIGEGVRIGDNTEIYPNVVIYPGTVIGTRVIIHAGTVIGADGFKYYADEHNRRIKVRHIGGVIIGDDVEIGANSCIDRAMLDNTIIGNGVKLDNLVQIGHNCVVGDHTVIAGGCGIAGSVTIGRNVTMAGQVGVADHVKIADNTMIAGKTGIMSDIGPGVFGGFPAQPIGEWRRAQVAYSKGPEMLRRLSALEKQKGE